MGIVDADQHPALIPLRVAETLSSTTFAAAKGEPQHAHTEEQRDRDHLDRGKPVFVFAV
jgi:hypothetical protein